MCAYCEKEVYQLLAHSTPLITRLFAIPLEFSFVAQKYIYKKRKYSKFHEFWKLSLTPSWPIILGPVYMEVGDPG